MFRRDFLRLAMSPILICHNGMAVARLPTFSRQPQESFHSELAGLIAGRHKWESCTFKLQGLDTYFLRPKTTKVLPSAVRWFYEIDIQSPVTVTGSQWHLPSGMPYVRVSRFGGNILADYGDVLRITHTFTFPEFLRNLPEKKITSLLEDGVISDNGYTIKRNKNELLRVV